ncbi:MAG: protein-L-isoaspartate O-methyltransferase [Patescibacteria group bacterium]
MFASEKEELISRLIIDGYLKTPRIIDAFRKIDRADFVLEKFRADAYVNAPLPIGYGQTISQPLTVAFMLELLKPEKGDKILDVGSGSGWQTALLAEIAGEKGKVFGVEVIPELKDFGEKNIGKYGFIEKGIVEVILAGRALGLKKEAPFDKIIVGAMAENVPEEFREQLKIGGRLVLPSGGSVWLMIKKTEDDFEEYEYPGFAFVPLVNS